MKLHLPKALLTAVLALGLCSGSAFALSVTSTFADTTTTHDTSADFSAVGYSYNASTGVITYDGGFGKFEATFTLDYDAFAALTADKDLLMITADKGTWGLLATANDTIIGRGAGQNGVYGNYSNGSISADTLSGYATGEGTSLVIADMKLSIDGTTANTGTQLKTADNQNVYVNNSLRYTPSIISSAKLDKSLITSITLKDVASYTVSNASGTWSKTYSDASKVSFNAITGTAGGAIILNNDVQKVVYESNSQAEMAVLAETGDVIIGGSGQLFLQTWSSSESPNKGNDITVNKDIYLGTSSQDLGALRLAAHSGAISLKSITLVEDTKITKEADNGNDNKVTITEAVSGAYTLTVAADSEGKTFDDVIFNGTVDLGGLTLAGTGGSDIVFGSTVQLGALTAQDGDHKATFNGATTINSLSVDASSSLVLAGTGNVTLGGGTLTETLENQGSGQVTLAGNLTISNITELKTGDGVTYSDNNGTDGYISSAEFIVIEGTGENATAALQSDALKVNETYTLSTSANGKNIVINVQEENPTGTYFVNTEINYGGDNGSQVIVADTTTGITMNGGKLNLNTALKDGVNIATVKEGSKINLAAGVELSNNAVSAGEIKSTIAGVAATETTKASVYNMGQVSFTGKETANVTFGSDWQGTVVFEKGSSFKSEHFNLNDFGGAGATIQFNGVNSGSYLQNSDATYVANIELKGDGFTIGNGYSSKTYTFTGAFSGDGTFAMNKGSMNGQYYVFAGDMSQWTGELKQNATPNGTTKYTYTFKDKSTNIANKITAAGGPMYVNVENSAAVTMSGDVTANGGVLNLTKTGGSKLTVNKMTAQSSNIVLAGTGDNAIEVGTLSIASGKTVTGTADVSVTGTLAVSAENALAITGALTLGNGVSIDLTGLQIQNDKTSYTLATASGGITGDISVQQIKNLNLAGTMYEGYSFSISPTDPTATTGIATVAESANSNTALVLTLEKATVQELTEITVTGGSYADGVLTFTTAEDLSAGLAAEFNIKFDDATWQSILKDNPNMAPEIRVALNNVNWTDEGVTMLTINGEGPIGGQLQITNDGTVAGKYVTAYIPEPTTSTLSLLALAALAVRRRRR